MREQRGNIETFLDSFSARAAVAPDATALVSNDARPSFGELDCKSNRLARYLGALGVDVEVCAAIYLDRSADVVLSMLAIMKAGGFFVVLNPADPLDRIAWILDNAKPAVVITGASLADRLPAHWGYNLDLSSEATPIEAESSAPVTSRTFHSAAVYMVYTSGSAGEPKGVVTPHGSLDSRTTALASLLSLGPDDAQLHLLNLSFDGSYSELFPILSRGGKLVISPGAPLSAAPLVEFCRRERITTFTLTPAYWHSLMGDLEACGLHIPETVRSVQVGGDRISVANVERWRRLTGRDTRFVNLYGPTEATIAATAYDAATLASGEAWLPIGTVLAGSRAYVLDAGYRPVAGGEIGELYLGGEGLAREYFQDARLTASRFAPDAFSPGNGARMYRTGDLARFDDTGILHFAGRADEQLKIRDHRIEPAEIEALLMSHPSVAQAAVVAQASVASELRLSAFVVLANDAVAAEDLQTFLSMKAPRHMEVDRVIVTDALPATSNGKVDRRVLAELAAARSPKLIRRVPRNHREDAMKRIWELVLRSTDVAMTDNFLDLGGDSLAATQIAARAAAGLDADVRVDDVFQHPTIGEFASVVSGRRKESLSVWVEDGAANSLEQHLLRDSLERRLIAVRVDGAEARPRLERAFRALIDRHNILVAASTVGLIGGGAKQFDEESSRGITKWAAEATSGDKAVRAAWADLGDQALFVMSLHPAVCDAWSANVIQRELLALYEALVRPELPPAPEPEVQYCSYAARDTAAVAPNLPARLPAATSCWSELTHILSTSSSEFEAPRDTLLGVVAAAAIDLLLSAEGRPHAPVSIINARRRPPAWQDLVGPVFDMSLLDPEREDVTVRELIAGNAPAPLNRCSTVLEKLARARGAGHLLAAAFVSCPNQPLAVSIDGTRIETVTLPGQSIAWLDVPPVFDLVLAIEEHAGVYRWALRSYSSDFSAEELEAAAVACERISTELLERPDLPVAVAASGRPRSSGLSQRA